MLRRLRLILARWYCEIDDSGVTVNCYPLFGFWIGINKFWWVDRTYRTGWHFAVGPKPWRSERMKMGEYSRCHH